MEYPIHVAISFAGEDRGIAEQIVTLLNSNGVKVFYDYDYQDEIWGKDAYVYLSDIYENQSLFFLPLISSNYAKKMWPRHEIRSAFARAFRASDEYILPVRLDDTQIQGIPLTIGYLDFRTVTIDKIVDSVLKKLRKKGVIPDKNPTASLQANFKKNPISNTPKDLVQFLGQLGIGKLSEWKRDMYWDSPRWYSLSNYFEINDDNDMLSPKNEYTLEGIKTKYTIHNNLAIYLESKDELTVEELKIVLNIHNSDYEEKAKSIFADLTDQVFKLLNMDIPIGLKNNITRGRESEFIHHAVKVKLSLEVSNVDTWRLIIS
jgi:TIR domain